jgi:hypothetical protein
VPNGIPDPCPDFEEAILPLRRKRMEEGYPGVLRLLFLGHCMESKGLLTSVRILAEYCKQTKKFAILDWIVMLFVRLWFRRTIFQPTTPSSSLWLFNL